MATIFRTLKIINIIALVFLLLGPYGLPITGVLQLISAFIFVALFPKNKLICIYFGLVATFFVILFFIWERDGFYWSFAIPIFLIFFLTYIIHFQKSDTKPFLTAEWKNLALINYEIDAEILKKHLPKGTEIDLWDGKCYVSLVGFMFENVKLLGVSIPFHTNFEEVNLRFYVKRWEENQWKRGVVFVKEIVPKPALTFVANTIYKEHNQTLPMKHAVTENQSSTDFVYQWKTKNKWNTISIEAEKNQIEIDINSEAEFITEHYFGFTKVNDETTFEYEVKHPRWDQFPVKTFQIDVDFKSAYGNQFEFLNHQKPISAMLAIGSEVSVENKKRLKP